MPKQEVAAKASSIREEFFQQFSLVMAPADQIKKKTDTGGRVKKPDGSLVDERVVVATLEIPEYSSNAEAIAAEGEAKWLSLGNSQNSTNKMNSKRQEFTGKTSNAAYEAEATAKIWQDDALKAQAQLIYTDPSTTPDVKAEKYNALVSSVIEQIRREKAGSGAVPDSTGEEA